MSVCTHRALYFENGRVGPQVFTDSLLFNLEGQFTIPSTQARGGLQPRPARSQVIPILLGEGDVHVALAALNPENLVAIGNLLGVDTLSLQW